MKYKQSKLDKFCDLLLAIGLSALVINLVSLAVLTLDAVLNEVHAEEVTDTNWTTTEIIKEVATVSLLTLDYKQTMSIRHYSHGAEANPILGHHPSDGRVKAYFETVTVGQLALANYLGHDNRNLLLNGTILLELGTTARNYKLGYYVKF